MYQYAIIINDKGQSHLALSSMVASCMPIWLQLAVKILTGSSHP